VDSVLIVVVAVGVVVVPVVIVVVDWIIVTLTTFNLRIPAWWSICWTTTQCLKL